MGYNETPMKGFTMSIIFAIAFIALIVMTARVIYA